MTDDEVVQKFDESMQKLIELAERIGVTAEEAGKQFAETMRILRQMRYSSHHLLDPSFHIRPRKAPHMSVLPPKTISMGSRKWYGHKMSRPAARSALRPSRDRKRA